ncbi:MAG: hypothetical protein KF906_10300 [Actinobacteria bacterium]|nr:hypothetical protein [Actinomycetota bacterium]
MVAIHAARTGVEMPRATTDVDVVVDVRAEHRAHAERLSGWLVASGFAIERNDEGTDRYRRDDARIDLLAPDNLGNRPVRTAGGGRILAAPGSTNALNRSGLVKVALSEDVNTVVRCPTAFGALMAKVEACVKLRETRARRLRHQQDIVTLAGVLAIAGYDDDRTARERRRFAEATAPLFDDKTHEAWLGASSDALELLRLLRG